MKGSHDFVALSWTYSFEVIPSELINAPMILQRMTKNILHHIPPHTAQSDRLRIFSELIGKHLQHLKYIFILLGKHSLKYNFFICEFVKSSVKLLGHIVGSTEISVDDGKVANIRGTAITQNFTIIRGLVALCEYHHRFIKLFAQYSAACYRVAS